MLRVIESKLPVRSTWRISYFPSCLVPCDLTRSSSKFTPPHSNHILSPKLGQKRGNHWDPLEIVVMSQKYPKIFIIILLNISGIN